MSEQQIEVSLEDQLLDAQMHVGRLENELALALKGIAPQLRWSTMRPAMSGVYLNAHGVEFEEICAAAALPWRIIYVPSDRALILVDGKLGPYWAGPLQIAGPE